MLSFQLFLSKKLSNTRMSSNADSKTISNSNSNFIEEAEDVPDDKKFSKNCRRITLEMQPDKAVINAVCRVGKRGKKTSFEISSFIGTEDGKLIRGGENFQKHSSSCQFLYPSLLRCLVNYGSLVQMSTIDLDEFLEVKEGDIFNIPTEEEKKHGRKKKIQDYCKLSFRENGQNTEIFSKCKDNKGEEQETSFDLNRVVGSDFRGDLLILPYGGYHERCEKCFLYDQKEFHCQCKPSGRETTVNSSIKINEFLELEDGRLVFRTGKRINENCKNFELYQLKFSAHCKGENGEYNLPRDVDLNRCLYNADGNFEIGLAPLWKTKLKMSSKNCRSNANNILTCDLKRFNGDFVEKSIDLNDVIFNVNDSLVC